MADSNEEGMIEFPLTETETLKCWPLLVSDEHSLTGGEGVQSSFTIPDGMPKKKYVVILAEVR